MITRLIRRHPRALMILVILLAVILATIVRRFHVGIYQSVADHARCRLLFVGDSLTAQAGVWGWKLGRWWPDSQNHAVSGADIYLIRAIAGEMVPALQPECVVVMGGINDLGRDHEPGRVLADYTDLLAVIRATGSVKHVIVLSTLYRRDDKYTPGVRFLNDGLRELCEREGLTFLDLRPDLCTNDRLNAEFAAGMVHLNAEGYRVWAEKLAPVLAEILK
jgi:lysophospholipase L1-like esterase